MQPLGHNGRHPRMPRVTVPLRMLIGLVLALAVAGVTPARVAACSCAGGELPDAIRAADIAFIGVAEAAAAGPPSDIGPRTLYLFSVERASKPTGATIEVAAWSGGDASCGFDFAIGETWLVLAHRWEGALDTNLCSGNVHVDGLAAAQRADFERLLPVLPEAAPEGAPEQESTVLERALPALLIGVGILALVGTVAVFGFARGRRNRDYVGS